MQDGVLSPPLFVMMPEDTIKDTYKGKHKIYIGYYDLKLVGLAGISKDVIVCE